MHRHFKLFSQYWPADGLLRPKLVVISRIIIKRTYNCVRRSTYLIYFEYIIIAVPFPNSVLHFSSDFSKIYLTLRKHCQFFSTLLSSYKWVFSAMRLPCSTLDRLSLLGSSLHRRVFVRLHNTCVTTVTTEPIFPQRSWASCIQLSTSHTLSLNLWRLTTYIWVVPHR